MANRTTIDDPSPRAGVFEGDLKYGRCEGTKFIRSGDFSSGREHGAAVNKPVSPLVLQTKRDPEVWQGKTKHKKIKRNDSSFQEDVMLALMKFTNMDNVGSLSMNSRIRITKFGKKSMSNNIT